MRRILIFIVSFGLLLGSYTAMVALTQERDFYLRGYVNPLDDEQELPFAVPRLGVNVSLEQYDNAQKLDEQLQLIQAAHMHWVRQVIAWDTIETRPGVYDWTAWDTVFDGLGRFPDLQPIVVITGTPEAYAHALATRVETAPPDDYVAFETFLTAFVERYGQQIHVYQIWDEPNLFDAWGGMEPNPAEYLALQQSAYRVIHDGDSDAIVLSASLAPTVETGPRNINEWDYLEQLYQLGLRDISDGIGAKAYGFNEGPYDRTVVLEHLNFSRVVMLREIMVAHDDANRGIWITNWGWNHLPDDWNGEDSIWGSVTSAQQISYTRDGLARAAREWPWAMGMALYHWQPIADEHDPIWGFSLQTPQTEPTPLLHALLESAPDELPRNGRYPVTHSSASYSGVWTFGDMGADVGWLEDSKFSFQFYGTDVGLQLRRGDYVAYVYPTIDGMVDPVNQLPQDSADNPYAILTSPRQTPQLDIVPIATGLQPTAHVLQGTVVRGWDQWLLNGYITSEGDLSAPYKRALALAQLTLGVTGVSTLVAAYHVNWRPLYMAIAKRTNRITHYRKIIYGMFASLLLMVGMLLTWNGYTTNVLRREPVIFVLSLVTAGLIYWQPSFLLVMLFALLVFWIVYNDTLVGVFLVIVWAPFFLFPISLYLYAFPMVEIILLMTFAAHLLRCIVSNIENEKTPAVVRPQVLHIMDILVALYVLVGIFSLVWTKYREPAITELRVLIVEPAMFYWVMRTTSTDKRAVNTLLAALVGAIGTASFISLVMYGMGLGIITAEGGVSRLAGIYGSPNNMALLLGRMLPFVLSLTLLGQKWGRYIGIFVFLGGGVTLILTQSAGGVLIGVPTSFAVMAIALWRRRSLPYLAGIAVSVMMLFGLLVQSPRFSRILRFDEGTNFFRIRVWQSAIQAIQDHPITGLGLDQFLYAFRGFYIMPDAWQEPNLSHPHNFILDIWTRLGLFGLLIFVGIQLIFWWNIFHIEPDKLSLGRRILWLGTVGSMANLLSHGMIDNSIFVNDLAIIFMLLLAIVMWLSSSENSAQTAYTDT